MTRFPRSSAILAACFLFTGWSIGGEPATGPPGNRSDGRLVVFEGFYRPT